MVRVHVAEVKGKCRSAGMQICKNSELLWHARPLQTLKSVILACLATPNAAHDYGDTVVQVLARHCQKTKLLKMLENETLLSVQC